MNGNFSDLYLEWETVGVVLGNTNAIDVPRLDTETFEKAHDLVLSYGYDADDSNHFRELNDLRIKALTFIETQLLQDPDQAKNRLNIPDELRRINDVRRLMVTASTDSSLLGKWACSLLRVMHTFTHIANDLSSNFFPAIQKQILDRILQFVHTDQAGDIYLGRDESGIRLYMLDIKTQKSAVSLALKLLHKEENTSADIFDRIGFRFVTFTKFDALQALRYLRENVVALPNVKTGRSRNTLIDIDRYHYRLGKLRAMAMRGKIDRAELIKRATDLADTEALRPEIESSPLQGRNLYSSTEYTSIQFTCRQLIRVKGSPIPLAVGSQKKPGLIDYKFFFPYEIQLLDKTSYTESRRGRASHSEYKQAQIRAARERVFPWLETEEM